MLDISLIGHRRGLSATPSFICRLLTVGAIALTLAACHHHDRYRDHTGTSATPPNYPIAGIIAGLGGATGLVLQNNGGDDLTVPANMSSFQFATWVAAGGGYNVTVATQPDGLTCTVSHGAGTHIDAAVTDVSVACDSVTYTIAGTISGLSTNGLVLQNNGGDTLTVDASDTTFSICHADCSGRRL